MGLWTALVIALALHCVLITLGDDDPDYADKSWEAYKKKYNKTYDTPDDEDEARHNFEKNQHEHLLHNMNDTHNYTQGVHEHSDKEPHEAVKILCRTSVPEEENQNRTRRNFLASKRAGEEECVDWTTKGAVSSVKNQGSCGSCWAFTAAQAIEGQVGQYYDKMYDVSEQEFVDCASSYGNNGCDGGWPDNAFEYSMAKGAYLDRCYPYTGKEGTCSTKKCYKFKVKDYVDVGPSGDEDAVAQALREKGPLAIAIHVDDKMMAYDGGIYHSEDCNKDVNHGVLLVGCGEENGVKYWKIKNSWGTSWGEKGYMRIVRKKDNMCKVASYASYPVLDLS